MRRILFLAAAGAILSWILVPGSRLASAEKDDLERGGQLYQKHCAVCHGEEGRGDGAAAYLLSPKPRDFTRGEYRLVTTTNGVPSDADLLRVLENGMPGSAMPPWDRLAAEDRKALAAVVKDLWRQSLRRELEAEEMAADEIAEFVKEDTTPGPVIPFAGEGEPTLEQIARGRIVYSQACGSCHGLEGRGDSNERLFDSRGFPAPARDFTKGVFKGGSEARQIYARLRSGMKGTAMPTFRADALPDADAWAVVHYVRTLFPPAAQDRQRQRSLSLRIRRVAALPKTDAEWWADVPPAYVGLMPLWWRDDRVEGVLFQAAHDGKTLAVRLVWEDPTQDLSNLRHEDFHDGAAAQFSGDADPPFFGMGDDHASVVLWSWKASWQEDQQGYRDLGDVYPAMNLDTYFPVQKNLKAGERPERGAVSAPHHDPTYLSGWGAGNPVSNPARPSAVEVGASKGLGSFTTHETQDVAGAAVWDRGVWTLTMTSDVAADRLRGLHVAFAVWDGHENDRNGQKSVSVWHRLDLE